MQVANVQRVLPNDVKLLPHDMRKADVAVLVVAVAKASRLVDECWHAPLATNVFPILVVVHCRSGAETEAEGCVGRSAN